MLLSTGSEVEFRLGLHVAAKKSSILSMTQTKCILSENNSNYDKRTKKESKCNLASRMMSRESRGGHVTDSRQ